MSYADQHKSWPMISILSAGFAALAFWASQSELDQLVRATGQVIPDARKSSKPPMVACCLSCGCKKARR